MLITLLIMNVVLNKFHQNDANYYFKSNLALKVKGVGRMWG